MQKSKQTNKVLTAALLAGTMLTTPVVAAEISGNVGATTDYIWRGNTQSSGDASLSGGIDVDFGNGFAVGTWVGSLGASDSDDANYEVDLYGSYSGEVSGFSYEIGYISYQYPGVANSDADFSDIYVSFGTGPFSVSYYMLEDAKDADVDADDGTYLSLDAEFPLSEDWSVALHYGLEEYDISEDDEDYAISLSKGDMSFTVSGDEGDDTRAIISWGASF